MKCCATGAQYPHRGYAWSMSKKDKPLTALKDPGGRSVFNEIPEPLKPRDKESDRSYAAFLLYCMQSVPSNRKIAKSMQAGESNVRYWRKRFQWEARRVVVHDSEWQALRAYRLLMDLQDGQTSIAALRVALDLVLEESGYASVRHAVKAQRQGVPSGPEEHDVNPLSGKREEPKENTPAPFQTPLSNDELSELDVQRHYRRLRSQVLRNHLREDDIGRQVKLIDGTLGLIAKRVASGEIEVKVSDIPALLKARAMLTGLPTENVAVHTSHKHEHTVVVESPRISQARGQGEGVMLNAIQDELAELQVIVNAVPRQVIESEQ